MLTYFLQPSATVSVVAVIPTASSMTKAQLPSLSSSNEANDTTAMQSAVELDC